MRCVGAQQPQGRAAGRSGRRALRQDRRAGARCRARRPPAVRRHRRLLADLRGPGPVAPVQRGAPRRGRVANYWRSALCPHFQNVEGNQLAKEIADLVHELVFREDRWRRDHSLFSRRSDREFMLMRGAASRHDCARPRRCADGVRLSIASLAASAPDAWPRRLHDPHHRRCDEGAG